MSKVPKKADTIKLDLERLLEALIERGVVDDQNYPLLRRVKSNAWEITFEHAEHVSLAMDDIAYEQIYRELREKRSYSMKLIDGALLQLMYCFEDEDLIQHRLAYYPSPDLRPFREAPDLYLRDELYLDIVSRRIVPFPLRFDLDKKAAREVVHPGCHLSLGDVRGCRIPVSAPLTPRWFIEFILRNFYQTDKHDFVHFLPRHRLNLRETITPKERGLIHVVVPTM